MTGAKGITPIVLHRQNKHMNPWSLTCLCSVDFFTLIETRASLHTQSMSSSINEQTRQSPTNIYTRQSDLDNS